MRNLYLIPLVCVDVLCTATRILAAVDAGEKYSVFLMVHPLPLSHHLHYILFLLPSFSSNL